MDRVLDTSAPPLARHRDPVVVALIAVYEMRARSESLVSVTPRIDPVMNQVR